MQSLQLSTVISACFKPGIGCDLDRVLRGPDAYTLEWLVLVERKDRADRDKAIRRLRLQRRGRDQLQIKDVVPWLASKCRNQFRVTPALSFANPVTRTMSSLGSVVVRRTSTLVT